MWNCPPSTILVPVDFGEASGRAVAVAASLARQVGARVRLLHAETLEAPPYFTHEQIASIEKQRKAARNQAEGYLRSFGRKHGLEAGDISVVDGPPVPLIVQAARDADLVIMGTHGRRGPSRWWMGSVAERVVHESRTPVLVVRSQGAASSPSVFQRPLLVSTPGAPDTSARRVAEGLARAFGGGIADQTAVCEADVAREHDATLIVVSLVEGTTVAGGANERWLRACSLPMLFVPELAAV